MVADCFNRRRQVSPCGFMCWSIPCYHIEIHLIAFLRFKQSSVAALSSINPNVCNHLSLRQMYFNMVSSFAVMTFLSDHSSVGIAASGITTISKHTMGFEPFVQHQDYKPTRLLLGVSVLQYGISNNTPNRTERTVVQSATTRDCCNNLCVIVLIVSEIPSLDIHPAGGSPIYDPLTT